MAPTPEPPAQGFPDKDRLIAWLDRCVLGDLRTLEAGIGIYLAHEGDSVTDKRGGANYLLAARCCLALEYFSQIYIEDPNAGARVQKYLQEFLRPINERYAIVGDLAWRAYRNGLIHCSWPKAITLATGSGVQLELMVGVKSADPHLAPWRQRTEFFLSQCSDIPP